MRLNISLSNCEICINGDIGEPLPPNTHSNNKVVHAILSHTGIEPFRCFFCKRKLKHYDPHIFRCGLRRCLDTGRIQTHVLVSKLLQHNAPIFEGLRIGIGRDGFWPMPANSVLIHTSNGAVYCNIGNGAIWLLAGYLKIQEASPVSINLKPNVLMTVVLPDPQTMAPGTMVIVNGQMSVLTQQDNYTNKWQLIH